MGQICKIVRNRKTKIIGKREKCRSCQTCKSAGNTTFCSDWLFSSTRFALAVRKTSITWNSKHSAALFVVNLLPVQSWFFIERRLKYFFQVRGKCLEESVILSRLFTGSENKISAFFILSHRESVQFPQRKFSRKRTRQHRGHNSVQNNTLI